MNINRYRSPSGYLSNVVFGLCEVCDGLVRILSFGRACTTLTLDYSRRQAILYAAKSAKVHGTQGDVE